MDYAPIFFAGFGIVYGLGIGCAEVLYNANLFSDFIFYICFFSTFVTSIIIPVYFYRINSFRNYGHSGCKKVNPKS